VVTAVTNEKLKHIKKMEEEEKKKLSASFKSMHRKIGRTEMNNA